MLDMGVWRHVKRKDCRNDCRLLGCRWVFKVKRNGVYHARLVAKGFSLIPGMDFTDNYSPVVNDVTLSERSNKFGRLSRCSNCAK